MKTRMEKYYTENNEFKRTVKNQEIYEKVNDTEIDNFNLNNNISVIGSNKSSIDIDNLKKILDQKYSDGPKRKSLNIEPSEPKDLIFDDEEEKEYDINVILAKAKENKNVDYNEDRFKKIRETQYNILSNLNIEKEEEEKEITDEEKKLMTLINTITSNELKKDADPLDLLSDLKGTEDTFVVSGANDKTIEIKSKEEFKEIAENNKKPKEDSFYTASLKITEKDFDDFKDLEKDTKSVGAGTVILIILVSLTFLTGIFLLLNNVFEWNLIS